MKSFRKLLLLLLVLLLIPMLTACDDDDDDDEKDSGGFTMVEGKNSAEGIVKTYVENTELLEAANEKVETTCMMLKNKAALKELDLEEDDEDDDENYTWEITKSKDYDKDSGVTDGVRAYVKSARGDEDAIQETALVEVTVTLKKDSGNKKQKLYFCTAKIGGTWYLVTDGRTADSITEAARYWENRSSKNYDDYDY